MKDETLRYMVALQPKFLETMMEKDDDQLLFPGTGYIILRREFRDSASCKDYLIIPRTIDDSSDEARQRSLWGMVDWPKIWDSTSEHSKLKLMLDLMFGKTTPTLAILKALAAQEGVEV